MCSRLLELLNKMCVKVNEVWVGKKNKFTVDIYIVIFSVM